ncbi:hypothetical protein GQ55_1G097200 [Panicum hallii var. hallii]|uniref:DUF834 domain-containing protein n=1 Tax=Panicum hallii var. hallii TaxID=1504633 RepID=A0A2T7F416_9POAL|nr:hypothetical protein GQ55_1G097200 [Panicum hallii var. hallii]
MPRHRSTDGTDLAGRVREGVPNRGQRVQCDDGPAARVAEEEVAVAAVGDASPDRGRACRHRSGERRPRLPVAAELSGEIEVGVDGAVEGWDCGPFGIEETP